jgi:hypothetical protein
MWSVSRVVGITRYLVRPPAGPGIAGQPEVCRGSGMVEETVPLAAPDGIVQLYGTFYGLRASAPLLDGARKQQMPEIGGGTGIW